MKYTPRLYAKALTTLLLEKHSEANEKDFLKNLLLLLEKNGDKKHLPEIIRLTERELAAKEGGREVLVETARKIPDLKKKLHHLLKPHDIVKEEINEELLAGARITINGESQIDASMKSQISSLFGAHYST